MESNFMNGIENIDTSLIIAGALNLLRGLVYLGVVITLGVIAFKLLIKFKRLMFLSTIKWTLLEVRIPKDVFKTPLAMELVLMNAMHYGSYGEWDQKIFKGRVPNWFSLEIVSMEG